MSHVRTQIREAAAAALAGVAAVSVSRIYPLATDDLPILLVYTDAEEISAGTLGIYRRALDLVIEIVVKGQFYDDDLNALLVGVEQSLNQSTLGGLCKPLAPVGITVTTDAGATPIGRARVTYRAIYFTEHAMPETAI